MMELHNIFASSSVFWVLNTEQFHGWEGGENVCSSLFSTPGAVVVGILNCVHKVFMPRTEDGPSFDHWNFIFIKPWLFGFSFNKSYIYSAECRPGFQLNFKVYP